MAPRTTAGRSAGLALAVLVLGAASLPSAASGQSGTGLYEPFPEAAVKKRAQRYVERLGERNPERGHRYSDAELAAGVFVPPGEGAAALPGSKAGGAASARAGVGDGSAVALPVQLVLLAAALALPAAAVANHTRTRAT